jgi:hypothetical protein
VSQFAVIQGDAGFVTVAAGAKAGIISKWNISQAGLYPDGRPRLRFRCQFSYVNDVLMNLKGMQKRVIVQMRTKYGQENVDILDWEEARFEGGVLTLENVKYVQGVVVAK